MILNETIHTSFPERSPSRPYSSCCIVFSPIFSIDFSFNIIAIIDWKVSLRVVLRLPMEFRHGATICCQKHNTMSNSPIITPNRGKLEAIMVHPHRHLTWKRGYRDARWTGKRLSIALSINTRKAWPVGRKTLSWTTHNLSLNFQPIKREYLFLSS